MSALEPVAPAGSARTVELFNRQIDVEKAAFRRIFKIMAMTIPVTIVIFIGLVWLAISNTTQAVLPALGIGALVGVPAGVFFGGAVGFLLSAESLDELDEATSQH